MRLKLASAVLFVILMGACSVPKNITYFQKGNDITVEVTVEKDGKWYRYAAFKWKVSIHKIDSYLSYRRIEPGYEVWNKIQICQRNLENFSEKVLADNNLTDGSCMNCHIYNQHQKDVSLFHLRGKKGGTILNRNGKLRKLNTKGVAEYEGTSGTKRSRKKKTIFLHHARKNDIWSKTKRWQRNSIFISE